MIEFQRAVDPLAELLMELRATLKRRASGPDLELRRQLRDVADHTTRAMPPSTSMWRSETSNASFPTPPG